MATPCTPRESAAPIVGFADQVEVVPLNRKMHDTKSISLLSSSERRQHGPIAPPAAQALEAGDEPQCHVHRMMTGQRRPLEMRYRPRTIPRPPRSLSRTSASFVTQVEHKLRAPLH